MFIDPRTGGVDYADGDNNAVNEYETINNATQNVFHDDNGNLTTDHRGYSYLYDYENRLIQISGEDIRAQTGTQSFVKTAPVNLIYVSDLKKLKVRNDSDKQFHAAAHTGFISQNVYLFCASEGLGTVVRGLVDRPALAKTMKLRPDQWITFVQSVGYPKEN